MIVPVYVKGATAGKRRTHRTALPTLEVMNCQRTPGARPCGHPGYPDGHSGYRADHVAGVVGGWDGRGGIDAECDLRRVRLREFPETRQTGA